MDFITIAAGAALLTWFIGIIYIGFKFAPRRGFKRRK